MTKTYGTIDVMSITPEYHERTCGYWYLVHSECMALTAFATEDALMRWLDERGLELVQSLPSRGTASFQRIAGSYREKMHSSYDAFFALSGERTRVLSNGQYTMGVLTKDDDGVVTVHSLNPNCRDRPVYDYTESRRIFN